LIDRCLRFAISQSCKRLELKEALAKCCRHAIELIATTKYAPTTDLLATNDNEQVEALLKHTSTLLDSITDCCLFAVRGEISDGEQWATHIYFLLTRLLTAPESSMLAAASQQHQPQQQQSQSDRASTMTPAPGSTSPVLSARGKGSGRQQSGATSSQKYIVNHCSAVGATENTLDWSYLIRVAAFVS